MMFRLYFTEGMPTFAAFSIRPQIESICRSRSEPFVRISGLYCFSITRELMGSWIMSKTRPKLSMYCR